MPHLRNKNVYVTHHCKLIGKKYFEVLMKCESDDLTDSSALNGNPSCLSVDLMVHDENG